MTDRPRRATASTRVGAVARRAVAVALLIALAGCTDPPSRGGSAAQPLTVRIAYGNSAGSVGSDVIDELAAASSAAVAIENVSDELGGGVPVPEDAEGDALARLRAGTADLTIIRAGRLALEGARDLAVLEAPMVVRNAEQARAIATDPLTADALGRLARLDLVGLAVVPGSGRHLFGYSAAVTAPEQLAGQRISVRPDAAVASMTTALHAIPDGRVSSARSDAVAAGELRAIDSSLDQAAAVDRPAVVTSNLVLYEKFDVVVVRRTAFLSLTAAQRSALRSRVRSAADRALRARAGESAALSRWCGTPGSKSVRLTAAQLARFDDRLSPVADTLATSRRSRALLSRMRALHDGTSDPDGTTCAGGSAPDRADLDLEPIGSQRVLDGVWRAEATADALRAGGGDDQTIAFNRGVWTFTIDNGLAVVDQPYGDDCAMRFTFAGDRVRLDMAVEGNDHCGGLAIGTFRITEDTARFVWTADVDGNPEFDQALFGTLTRTST